MFSQTIRETFFFQGVILEAPRRLDAPGTPYQAVAGGILSDLSGKGDQVPRI